MLWIPGGPVVAQPLVETLSRAPAQADLVITVRDLAEFRKTGLGASWAELLTILYPRDGDARRAWQQLASMLDRDDEASFDALFGQRVSLICGSIWDDESAGQWMLVSRVSKKFERELLRALKAAPREIVNHIPLYALEQGRFIVARTNNGNGPEILICPRDSLDLLVSFVKDNQRATIDVASIRRLQAADGLVWIRGEREEPWWGAGAVSFHREHTAVDMTLRFEKAQKISPAWDISTRLIPGEKDVIRIVERAGEEMPFKPMVQTSLVLEQLAGEMHTKPTRSLVVVEQRDARTVAAGIALAFEQNHELAFDIDRTTAGLLVWISSMLGQEQTRHDFDGQYPKAMRQVELAEPVGIPLLKRDGLTVAWQRLDEEGSEVWWGWGTEPELVRSLAPGEAPEESRLELRDWLTAGSAYPNRMLGILHAAGLPIPERVKPLALLERLSWWVWQEDAHTARGTIMLDMRIFTRDKE